MVYYKGVSEALRYFVDDVSEYLNQSKYAGNVKMNHIFIADDLLFLESQTGLQII